jgi:hypothetical protein
MNAQTRKRMAARVRQAMRGAAEGSRSSAAEDLPPRDENGRFVSRQ